MCRPDQVPGWNSLSFLQEASDLASAARVAFAMAASASPSSSAPPPTTTRILSSGLGLPMVSSSHQKLRVIQLTQRQTFLLFIKVLLKYLEKVHEVPLRRRVKAIVAECVQRNRQGEQEFSPLPQAIQVLLHKCVGEVHWARTRLCVEALCEKRHWRAAAL